MLVQVRFSAGQRRGDLHIIERKVRHLVEVSQY